ncbi:aminotransferase class III-fold pyridoxal phosphate-dependent enzyme [Brackiella oedipodis]|uniref:aminotransferase class III-fold pyridoxal phosphate-dependent enzyme n=1 Tax=Brackiella oedipodis TaxID=124225 RepID=UPI00048C18A1|nr:aminotransferase class III-fold pyridoxal phosphate-dependent enzyme [Brackiella oedipodis]
MATAASSNQAVVQANLEHVFHGWVVQDQFKPLAFKTGHGCYLEDFEGKQYLDISSQLVNTNMGYQHPEVLQKIIKQAEQLITISPSYADQARAEAAQAVLRHAPQGFNKVFFTNAGADAIENAIRMCRLYTGRHKVLSSYYSYHGNTGAAIQATGDNRRFPNEYALHHVHFFSTYTYRSAFGATSDEQECESALRYLRRVIESEGPQTIACILLESMPGSYGVIRPPQDYMKGVKALCDEFDIMFIMDEVMVGFGRTGKWLTLEHFDVTPDLITFAKGVNGGYVPGGGVIMSEKFTQYFADKFYPGGLTYSGHPLAMAAITANIEAMEKHQVVENAAQLGTEVLAPSLQALAAKHDIIGEVRGLGLFWAIEFVADKQSKQKLPAERMNKIKDYCYQQGVLPLVAENRIHVAPPLIISREELQKALKVLDAAIAQA